jgi:membrane-associated phospholipid phosphatase
MNFIQQQRYYLVGLGLLLCAALSAILFWEKGELIVFFSNYRTTLYNYFFIYTTMLGEAYVYILAVAAFVFIRYRWAVSVLSLGLLSAVFSNILKLIFAQPRPAIYFTSIIQQPELIQLVPNIDTHMSWTSSFPSGHTTSAFAFYGLLAFLSSSQAVKLLCLLCAALVGISRMYLVQHFLEDVTAGMILGTGIAVMVYQAQLYSRRYAWADRSLLS